MKKMVFFSFLFLALVKANGQKLNSDPAQSPKTALILLKISKTGGEYVASIKKITLVAGAKKMEPQTRNDLPGGKLIGFILDQNKKTIDSISIKDPLNIRYEYPNDNGTIGSKTVELTEKEILLRYPYDSRMKYLRLVKPEANKKLKTLTTLELPLITD